MNEKYILVALMGTNDRATDEYPFIKLYAKHSELTGLPTEAAALETETPEDNFTPAGIMAVLNPVTETVEPINLYARFKEWLGLSMIASAHITGGDPRAEGEAQ